MAKNLISLFLFSVFTFSATFGQLIIPAPIYDFGTLRRADPNWTDLKIENRGSTDAQLFRVEGPKNTDIKLSSRTVAAGASEYIRIAVSPKSIGIFNIELLVYASAWQKPEKIVVKGESSFSSNGLIPCPAFGSDRVASTNHFMVSVRDFSQNIPMQNASVQIYQDGKAIAQALSNEHGELAIDLPYGRYFFSISSQSARLDTAIYVTAVNDHLLAKLENIDPVVEDVPPPIPLTPRLPKAETNLLKPDRSIPTANLPIQDTVTQSNDVLPLSLFKKNNLVFLVDVSSSMKGGGKLDLLKIAMIELLDVMRPVDRFSLISYASETHVVMETESNLDKAACERAIAALEAGGGTAGARAIDNAGKMALKNFVEHGNNQIILATDGAFNEGNDKALTLAEKYKRKDIGLSVLGIKCGKFATSQMTELVMVSDGRFIPINKATDAGHQLIDEVKNSSRK